MRTLTLFIALTWALLQASSTGRCQDAARTTAPKTLWPTPPIADPPFRAAAPEQADDISGDLRELRWDLLPSLFRGVAPTAESAPIVQWQGSSNRAEHQQVVTLGFSVPAQPAQETTLFSVGASLASRDDSVQAGHNVQNVVVTVQTALPQPVHTWYLKVDGRANAGQSEQLAVSAGTAHRLRNGSRITYSIGLTRRDARGRLQRLGGYIANTTLNWKWNDRLSTGLRFDYYPETHSIDALLSLDMQSRVPPR